jgi:hypothetical protein
MSPSKIRLPGKAHRHRAQGHQHRDLSSRRRCVRKSSSIRPRLVKALRDPLRAGAPPATGPSRSASANNGQLIRRGVRHGRRGRPGYLVPDGRPCVRVRPISAAKNSTPAVAPWLPRPVSGWPGRRSRPASCSNSAAGGPTPSPGPWWRSPATPSPSSPSRPSDLAGPRHGPPGRDPGPAGVHHRRRHVRDRRGPSRPGPSDVPGQADRSRPPAHRHFPDFPVPSWARTPG